MNVTSIKTAETGARQQVSPVVVALLAIVLIAFIVWRAWSAFAGPPTGKLPPPPTQDINFIQQKAKECQGDFTKLSPEDQAKVQKITMGFGQASMASTYRKLSKSSP